MPVNGRGRRVGAYQGEPATVGRPLIGPIRAQVGDVRRVIPVPGWARSLRRRARVMVWALPGVAVSFALAGVWGWPGPSTSASGPPSPGIWLGVVLLGLCLGLVAVIALTALLSATTGRRWAVFSLLAMLAGTLALTPMLGVLALARPSVSRMAGRLGASDSAELDHRLFDGTASRVLGAGGLVVLGIGWFSLGCAIITSHVLNRADGLLLVLATPVAWLAVYLSWPFLLAVASMLLLASALGVAFDAARLVPETGAGDAGG